MRTEGVLSLTLVICLFHTGGSAPTVKPKDLRVKLPSGDLMPLVGFGTSPLKGDKLLEAMDNALAAGYRLFDSAALYHNEETIGKALKELLPKYNLTRKDVFITSKLDAHTEEDKTKAAIENSFKNLDSEYIDLYLIHWPGLRRLNDSSSPESSKVRDTRWQEMVKAVKNGLIKNIGVSNYEVRHLKELLANDHGVRPVVNQVEWHPFYHQQELLDFCKKEGIQLQAYFSLGHGHKALLEHPEIKKIAEKLGKTTAQVLLRWALQQGIAIIPKSTNPKRMKENLEIDFVIPDEDMKTLNGFSQTKFPWFPKVEWHPFYHPQELLDFCKKEGIQLQDYFSLGHGNKELLEHPEIKKVAEKLGKTTAHVLLRWALQQDIAVIPKSTNPKRMQENLETDFVIPDDDMKTLNIFNQKKYAWNPSIVA